jgi:hypothetical protein
VMISVYTDVPSYRDLVNLDRSSAERVVRIMRVLFAVIQLLRDGYA